MRKYFTLTAVLLGLSLNACGPLVNEATTSCLEPPQFLVSSGDITKEKLNTLRIQPCSKIPAYTLTQPPSTTFSCVLNAAEQMPRWKIIKVSSHSNAMQAVAETLIFRFEDDLVIELRATKDQNTAVHMRSRSRIGKSDLGANKRRINSFFTSLQQCER